MTHYESKALAMIRESHTWAYWCISRRVGRALKRLEKRGVIQWTCADWPYWKFTIRKTRYTIKTPNKAGEGSGK